MNGRRGIAGCGVRRDAVAKAECGAPTAITAPRARGCPLRPVFARRRSRSPPRSPLPAAAQTMTDPVWSATMTAGDTRVGHGYDATDTPDTPAIGALDDDDFDYGSLPYRVLAIDVTIAVSSDSSSSRADNLRMKPHAGVRRARARILGSGSDHQPTGLNLYWLVPAALDDLETEFPVGSTATVCLRTATQVCPTGSIVTPPAAGVSGVARNGADRDRTGHDRGQLHGGARHRADARCHGDGRRALGHGCEPECRPP